MTGSLLDTSVLIAPAPAETDSLPLAAAISVITLGELRAGVLLAQDDSLRVMREVRLQAVRRAFVPIGVDESVADRYGEILALARSQDRTSKATDLLIIATAAAHDRKLFTRDQGQAGLAREAGVPVDVLS